MTVKELAMRIQNALILLSEGHACKVGDLTLQCTQPHLLKVTGWSVSNDLKTITKRSALSELAESKNIFIQMISSSEELASFVNEKQIEFILGFDYGMGSVHICREINGKLQWEEDLKQ